MEVVVQAAGEPGGVSDPEHCSKNWHLLKLGGIVKLYMRWNLLSDRMDNYSSNENSWRSSP